MMENKVDPHRRTKPQASELTSVSANHNDCSMITYLGARSPFMHHRARFSVGLAASPPGQTKHSTLSLRVIIQSKCGSIRQRLQSLLGYTRCRV